MSHGPLRSRRALADAAVRDAEAELARRQADRAAGPAGAPADRQPPESAAEPVDSDA